MNLELFFGLNRLVIGIVVLLITYKVIKTSPNSWATKRPVLFKYLSAFLIISGSYSIVISLLPGNELKEETWTEYDKEMLIQNCIEATGENGKKYPEHTKVYCTCAINNVTDSISKKDYISLLKKPAREQMEHQLKYIEDCREELHQKIKAEEAQE